MLFGSKGRKTYCQTAPRVLETFKKDARQTLGRPALNDAVLLFMAYTHFALAYWGQKGEVTDADTQPILTSATIAIDEGAAGHTLTTAYLYRTAQFFRTAIMSGRGDPVAYACEFYRLAADQLSMPADVFAGVLARQCLAVMTAKAAA